VDTVWVCANTENSDEKDSDASAKAQPLHSLVKCLGASSDCGDLFFGRQPAEL